MVQGRKCWLVLGFSALGLGGCTLHEPDLHSEQLNIEQAPRSLVVNMGSGDVSLRGAAVAGVFVGAKIDGPTNHVGYELVDGVLTVFEDCNEEPCSVDLDVELPANLALSLRAASGDILLENLRGDISLDTGSGDIEGWGLAGVNFSAETGSGDTRLELSPARRVHLKAGSGDVSLTVPGGAYRLDISTGSGDRELAGVSNDASAEGSIEVTTGSGDLKIEGI